MEPATLQMPISLIDSLLLEIVQSPADIREAANLLRQDWGGSVCYSRFVRWMALEIAEDRRPPREGSRSPRPVPLSSLLLRLTNQGESFAPDVIISIGPDRVEVSVPPGTCALPALAQVARDLRWLYRPLRGVKRWMIETQRVFYQRLAEYQEPFLRTGHLDDLRSLPITRAHQILGLPHDPSTYSRLTANRRVQLEMPELPSVLLDVRLLMPTPDDILRYEISLRLNALFQREAENRFAQSDAQLAEAVGAVRRTVAKYREEAGIPPSTVRQRLYGQGLAQEPYSIVAGLQPLLKPLVMDWPSRHAASAPLAR